MYRPMVLFYNRVISFSFSMETQSHESLILFNARLLGVLVDGCIVENRGSTAIFHDQQDVGAADATGEG